MKRKEFTQGEKDFFRTCFPRFSRSDIPLIMNGNKGIIMYTDERPEIYGIAIPFPDGASLMCVNKNHPQEQIDITIVHEMLHSFYEEFRVVSLYGWLCNRHGKLMDKSAGFLKRVRDGGPGSMYYQQWEGFLDDEAQTLHEEDHGLVSYIRTFFREETYKKKWRKRYRGDQLEWVYE